MREEICHVCGEPRSLHVVTEKGPLTHPREARGEGHYEQVSRGSVQGSYWPGEDDIVVPPRYKFVPATSTKEPK